MDKLDQAYLTDLVIRGREGNSNAFAELYAATCHRVWDYLYRMLQDREQTIRVMTETGTLALRGLSGLTSPELYLPWLCRLCFTRCVPVTDGSVQLPFGSVPLNRLMQLPLAESQVLVMRYAQGMSAAEVEDTLNFTPRLLSRTVRSARRHLERFGGDEESGEGLCRLDLTVGEADSGLDAQTRALVLEEIFSACGWEANTVPLEALSSYAAYRRERFTLQRRVLAGAMLLFLILPLLFIAPRYEVRSEPAGERGLPVYTVTLHSWIPTASVTADMRGRSLPVYEAGARTFTVEPTRNGELRIRVKLKNLQTGETVLRVRDVDTAAPRLTGSETDRESVRLTVRDEGIGVDYREACAVSSGGERILPLSWDTETGEILFSYPEEDWDVYIPDHIGNTLHLALTLDR